MKTILIILLSILAGFCFYTSDPLVLTAPAQIGSLLAVFGIGCLVGNMTKKSGKLKKVRKMNKSLLRANGNLRAKNQEQQQELDRLKNVAVNANLIYDRLDKLRTENDDLKKSLLSIQGNLKQVQKKYSDAKEQATLLLFERNHLKETIADLLQMLIKINNIENEAFYLNGFDIKRLKSDILEVIKKATE